MPADTEIITAEGASVALQAEGALLITIVAGREVALESESSVAPLDDRLAE